MAVQDLLNTELTADTPDITTIIGCLRGLSFSRAQGLRRAILLQLLESPLAHNIDLLAAVAARCWNDLQDTQICQPYVEALAGNTLGQDGFNQILADLMFIPGMRPTLLTQLRNPSRTKQLTAATEQLFNPKNR